MASSVAKITPHINNIDFPFIKSDFIQQDVLIVAVTTLMGN
jgi:hypothetical protein